MEYFQCYKNNLFPKWDNLKTLLQQKEFRGSSKGVLGILKIHKDKEILFQEQAHSDNYMSVLHQKQSVNKKQKLNIIHIDVTIYSQAVVCNISEMFYSYKISDMYV